MIRKTIVAGIATVMLFALINVTTVAAKTDFSGTWVLDMSKSEGLRPGVNQMMTVKHTDDKIEFVTKVMAQGQSDEEIKDAYFIDGKGKEFLPVINGVKADSGTRTVQWSKGGNGIDIVEKATKEGLDGVQELNVVRHWELSADGKTLTLEMKMAMPMGERKTKRVFVKK